MSDAEGKPILPEGYQPGCSNWRCSCWRPGPVCDGYMGMARCRHCPRCGWTREHHKPVADRGEDHHQVDSPASRHTPTGGKPPHP